MKIIYYLIISSLSFFAILLTYIGIIKLIISLIFYKIKKVPFTILKLQLFALLLFIIMVVTTLYSSKWDIYSVWNTIDSFATIDEGNFNFQYLFFLIIINVDTGILLFMLIVYLVTKFMKSHSTQSVDIKGHGIVIAAHNSSDKLQKTILKLLLRLKPCQIFVADNGSNSKEIQKTRELCTRISLDYMKMYTHYKDAGINHLVIAKGNKTIAQFITVNYIKQNLPHIKLVTLIDDDTQIPYAWTEQKISSYFDDEKVACLAYPIKVSNKVNVLTYFQNLEYLIACNMKIAQSKIGSTLFGSGAFTTWRVDFIVDVLLRHDTKFHGDDLQQGMILHNLYKKKWIEFNNKKYSNPTENIELETNANVKIDITLSDVDKKNSPSSSSDEAFEADMLHEKNYKVATCDYLYVTTDAPVCYFHLKDILRNRTTITCTCGEPSLFKQRALGWDLSRQCFFPRYLKLFLQKTKISRLTIWIKILLLLEVLGILNDLLIVGYSIYIFVAFSGGILFIVRSFLLATFFQMIALFICNWIIFLKERAYVEVVALFTLCYKFPNFWLKYIAMIYYLTSYIYEPKGQPIRSQYVDSGDFKNMVDELTNNDCSTVITDNSRYSMNYGTISEFSSNVFTINDTILTPRDDIVTSLSAQFSSENNVSPIPSPKTTPVSSKKSSPETSPNASNDSNDDINK